MKNRKKEITLLIIGILTLISLVVGATYAYFKAVIGNEANANINVGAGTTDNLIFTKGSDLTLNVSADNLSKGDGLDVSQNTNVTATLVANNTTNEATKTYNVYLEVLENDLEYSSFTDPDNKLPNLVFKTEYEKTLGNNRDYNGLTYGYDPRPELFLTIEGPTNFNKEIEGLKKATLQTEDDSYDITELREGIYALAEDFQINVSKGDANLQKTDTWNIKVIFKNLDSDQQLNTNKKFSARIIIQAEKLANDLSDVCKNGDNLANCIKELHKNSVYGASNLIYHDGKADYDAEENYELEAGDKSYRYTGSYEKVNNYICFGKSCSTNPSEPEYNNLYRIVGTFQNKEGQYETKLVKADYANTDTLGSGSKTPTDIKSADSQVDGSYSGVRNGTTGNNLDKDGYTHRYKGSLESIGRYYWQASGTQETVADWTTSLLNSIHLNTNYYNSIESAYQSLIKEYEWMLGNKNATWGNIVIAKDVKTTFDNELGNLVDKDTLETDSEYIGLLYVSDYLYGAAPSNWNKKPYTDIWNYTSDGTKKDKYNNPAGSWPMEQVNNDYRSTTDSNWLYMGLFEWLITVRSDIKNSQGFPAAAFSVATTGAVHNQNSAHVGANALVIRPSFYIDSNVKYKSGTGTASDPYILDV